ncbi:hypothetical protein JCM10450v2_003368 [Rhodotorula kratochvilovae]
MPLLRALLVLALALPLRASAQQITSPPSLLQCLPASLTIQGGQAPYTVSVLPGGQVAAAPLETLPPVTAPGTVTWLVDLPAVTFAVRDAAGVLGYSAPITILPGTDDSCIGANSAATALLVPTTTITNGSSPVTTVATSNGTTSSAPEGTSTTIAAETTSALTSERPTSLPRPTTPLTTSTGPATTVTTPPPATVSPVSGASSGAAAGTCSEKGSTLLLALLALSAAVYTA